MRMRTFGSVAAAVFLWIFCLVWGVTLAHSQGGKTDPQFRDPYADCMNQCTRGRPGSGDECDRGCRNKTRSNTRSNTNASSHKTPRLKYSGKGKDVYGGFTADELARMTPEERELAKRGIIHKYRNR